MNYLAHAYLSFGDPAILTGNMISDFIKGKKKFDYPEDIQQGIALHRAIDDFTDRHPITRQAKAFFSADYGLYAGPLTDVIYDHFLANDPLTFPAGSLAAFAKTTYEQLGQQQERDVFPERFARMFIYMRSQDWLYNYRTRQGIYNSLQGLSRRALYMPGPEKAGRLFEEHYLPLQSCYNAFFPELRAFALSALGKAH